MLRKLSFLCFVMMATVGSSFSQGYKNEFGFKSDNDAYLFLKQDRYYTNGLSIYFRRAIDQQILSRNLEKVTYEISAGQKIYNPLSGQRPDPATHDRPFAGHLYGGVQASFFYKKESLLKIDINLGVVGPDAFGEEVQRSLHDAVGFYMVRGWEYQIHNNLAANASVQFAKLVQRSSANTVDLTLDSYVNLGTTHNGAGIGFVFRAGHFNQLFNTSYYNAAITNNGSTKKLRKKEIYLYARPQLNYVAYDATVQGGLFDDTSPITFDVRPIFFAQQLGFDYSTPRFTFDYSFTFQSRQIKSKAKAHQYGSVSMYYRFN